MSHATTTSSVSLQAPLRRQSTSDAAHFLQWAKRRRSSLDLEAQNRRLLEITTSSPGSYQSRTRPPRPLKRERTEEVVEASPWFSSATGASASYLVPGILFSSSQETIGQERGEQDLGLNDLSMLPQADHSRFLSSPSGMADTIMHMDADLSAGADHGVENSPSAFGSGLTAVNELPMVEDKLSIVPIPWESRDIDPFYISPPSTHMAFLESSHSDDEQIQYREPRSPVPAGSMEDALMRHQLLCNYQFTNTLPISEQLSLLEALYEHLAGTALQMSRSAFIAFII
ncbi:hypothetical protein AX16_002272 [Volvariella volvacea WC 439]|nr:hypothetical protein AX16_002272 [Volvariella volvacea WC 439]